MKKLPSAPSSVRIVIENCFEQSYTGSLLLLQRCIEDIVDVFVDSVRSLVRFFFDTGTSTIELRPGGKKPVCKKEKGKGKTILCRLSSVGSNVLFSLVLVS